MAQFAILVGRASSRAGSSVARPTQTEPQPARVRACAVAAGFLKSGMFEAETGPKRNLLLMTFRERIGPAVLAQGRAQVAVALERLSA